MEKQNDKLILDENVNESIDSYKPPMIYGIIASIYNFISILLTIVSLILLLQAYSDFVYKIFDHPIYIASFTCNEILGFILLLSFVAWIGLSILFYILNWVELGQLAKRKWIIFNTISGILAYYSIWFLLKDFD
jgi:hypothetical protein